MTSVLLTAPSLFVAGFCSGSVVLQFFLAESLLWKPLACFCPWMVCHCSCFLLIHLLITYQATFTDMYPNIYPTRCNVTQFILSGICSTCFGRYHHPSSGAQTTVSTASGICHAVIAICRYHGRVGTGLSVLLWVAYATHSNNGVTNTRCCRYSCLRPWWWVMVPPETCRADSR